MLELVGASCRLGFDVEIVATNDDGPGLLEVPLGKVIEYEGAPVRFFPRFSPPLRPIREFAFSPGLALWLERHIEEYDLLHVHALFSYAPSVAMRIARRHGVPYINRPSGLLCRWSLLQSRRRKQIFLAVSDRLNLSAASAIEFTAEQERDEVADLGLSTPSFVMPYGLHLPALIEDARQQLRHRLSLAANEPIILFLSRLHPKKGLHHLLSALELLKHERFTVVVAGVGAAGYESTLRAQVAAGPLLHRVHFVGFASGKWKQILLQGADLFVLPSHSESFAIAAMEALAAGVPVLTTHEVPIAMLVQKFNLGWICNPDIESLRCGISMALSDITNDEFLSDKRRRSRQLIASNFTWNDIACRTQAVYDAILLRRPLPTFELATIVLS